MTLGKTEGSTVNGNKFVLTEIASDSYFLYVRVPDDFNSFVAFVGARCGGSSAVKPATGLGYAWGENGQKNAITLADYYGPCLKFNKVAENYGGSTWCYLIYK